MYVSYQMSCFKSGVVVHTYNPSTGKVERQEDREFKASLDCIVRTCLKNQTNKKDMKLALYSHWKTLIFRVETWKNRLLCWGHGSVESLLSMCKGLGSFALCCIVSFQECSRSLWCILFF
jgi:hypothetical protein